MFNHWPARFWVVTNTIISVSLSASVNITFTCSQYLAMCQHGLDCYLRCHVGAVFCPRWSWSRLPVQLRPKPSCFADCPLNHSGPWTVPMSGRFAYRSICAWWPLASSELFLKNGWQSSSWDSSLAWLYTSLYGWYGCPRCTSTLPILHGPSSPRCCTHRLVFAECTTTLADLVTWSGFDERGWGRPWPHTSCRWTEPGETWGHQYDVGLDCELLWPPKQASDISRL